jgi:hypothetical protein
VTFTITHIVEVLIRDKRIRNIFTIYFGVSLSNEFEMNFSEMVRKRERKERKERIAI